MLSRDPLRYDFSLWDGKSPGKFFKAQGTAAVLPSEVNLQCKGALGVARDALYGKPLAPPRMNWEQGLSCVIPADCPSSLLCLRLPPVLAADWAVAVGALCSRQMPALPAGHQVCNTRSLEVTVPLFLPPGLQVSCLPDLSSGPQAAAVDTHVPNPMGFPTAPRWSEGSDRKAHVSPGAVPQMAAQWGCPLPASHPPTTANLPWQARSPQTLRLNQDCSYRHPVGLLFHQGTPGPLRSRSFYLNPLWEVFTSTMKFSAFSSTSGGSFSGLELAMLSARLLLWKKPNQKINSVTQITFMPSQV